MATSNSSRDVRLGIEVETAGEESVKRLASAVRSLGQEGDPAAVEFNRLADELDRLAQQAGAIQSVGALRADVEKLTTAERATTAAATAATTAFLEQKTATDTLREAQARARAEAAQAKTAYDDLKLVYQSLKNAGAEAGQSQESYNAALREAKQQVDEQNRALKARRDALSESNRQVTEAAAAERALSREFDLTTKAAASTGSALAAQAEALQKTEAAAVALGANVTDLAAAEEALLAATRAYIADVAVQRRQVSIEQAEADRLAAIETRALAEAQHLAAIETASELAAIRDSEQFTRKYTAAKAEAAAQTLRLAQAEEQRVATLIDQNAADRDAFNATQNLAEARARSVASAESELAAIRDSEAFIRQYAAAQRDAAAAADAKAAADERASAAARDAAASEAAAAAQFAKLADQAAIANLFAQELDRIDSEATAAAAATRRLAEAGEAVTAAFGQTGVRSLQAIRAEMTGVTSSLGLLQRQFNAGAIGADDLARASSSAQVRLATLRRELQTMPALPNVFEKINSTINDLIGRFGSLTAAVATVGFALKPIVDADIAFESLRRTLTVVTGSAEEAGRQIEFLRNASNLAGLSAGGLSQSFQLFEASLLKSGASLQTTQQLFNGVANAAGVLGLSTDRVNGILVALGQIANKGKVSLEELQGQIGEALPGALKIAADSLGITTAQLGALLKEGKLLAEDFLPAFGKQLNDTFGQGQKPVEGLGQAFNRLKNAATETAQRLVDTSAYKALTSVLDATARNFDTVVASTVSLGKAFLAFKAIGIAQEFFGIKAAAEAAAASKLVDAEAAAVQTVATQKAAAAIVVETEALNVNTAARTRNVAASGAGAAVLGGVVTAYEKTGAAVAGATSKIGAFVGALGGPYVLALTTTIAFSEQLGNGLAYVAAKATGAVDALKKNEEILRKTAEAEKAAAAAAQARADVVSASFVQTQVRFEKELKAVETSITVSERLVKAKKEEGATSIQLADLAGNEAKQKQAAVDAANANAIAITTELGLKQNEVKLLEQEREALVKAAGAQSTWSESRKQFFLDFDQQLAKKKADLEVTSQQAAADVLAADKAFLAAQAYGDNSAKIEALKLEVAAATGNVEALTKAFSEGLTTQARVIAASRELAVTQGLLKDAYADATAAITRRSAALKETQALDSQAIDIARKRITTDLAIADATNSYSDKLQAQTKLKQLDVTQSEQNIAASNKEAAALRERAALMQDQLKLGDPLYAQKQREIDLTLNAAKAKTNEGLIEQENLRQLRIQLGLVEGTLYQTAKGFDTLGGSVDAATAKIIANKLANGEALTSSERLAAANTQLAGSFNSLADAARNASVQSKLGTNAYDKSGNALDSSGNLLTISGQVNVPAGYVFDQAAFERATKLAIDTHGKYPDPAKFYKAPSGVAPTTGFGATPNAAAPAPTVKPASSSSSPSPTATPASSSHTVEILLTGSAAKYQNTIVSMSSQADAASLVAILKQLNDAARSAGSAP